ncbi:MAG: DEAD/DEAH box helicase [Chloroflexi bacterium]|nr:DEAD/DEAH box helicase [Chloroflexota bacterium]
MKFVDFNLDPRLMKGVQRMAFREPTPIQAATVPMALTGQDILGSAETGTGKTAAFMLPLLHRLLAAGERPHKLRALILVPTRELALQVADHTKQLSAATDLRSAAIYGGVGLGPQETQLRRGLDIVIATPGRLLDHVERRNVKFDGLEILVLDEADRMLDVGFLPDLRRIARLLPAERQTMLFSATLIPSIVSLAGEMTRQPVRIQVEKTSTPPAITQILYPVAETHKVALLSKLLNDDEMQSVLVFTRTKHRADRIAKQLHGADIRAQVIHGNRSQSQRVAALEAFRRGKSRVLVATDIAARGLDVQGVSHVVNFDMPMVSEDYVHRIGRTGRAHAAGIAVSLATASDEEMVRKIEGLLKQKIERRHVEGLTDTTARYVPSAQATRRSFGPRRLPRRPGAFGRRSI